MFQNNQKWSKKIKVRLFSFEINSTFPNQKHAGIAYLTNAPIQSLFWRLPMFYRTSEKYLKVDATPKKAKAKLSTCTKLFIFLRNVFHWGTKTVFYKQYSVSPTLVQFLRFNFWKICYFDNFNSSEVWIFWKSFHHLHERW